MLFGTWLGSVRARQQDDGVDHRELATWAHKLTPYVKDELSSALHALESLYIRLPPEVLNDTQQRERWLDLRESYIRDVRKALDHVGATLAVIGCTDEELSDVLSGCEGTEKASEEEDPEDATVSGANESDVTAKLPVLTDVLAGDVKEEV